MTTAFQSDSFENDSFQIDAVGGGTPTIDVGTADFSWEAQSVADVLNIIAVSADFSWEGKSVTDVLNITTQSADFSWEANSVAATDVINVQSADFSWEAQSTTAIVNVAVQSADFSWEALSATLAFTVGSADFSWEAKSVGIVPNIVAVSADFSWEAQSVADVLNVAVQSADFSWEAQSVAALVVIAVQSADFSWETSSAADVLNVIVVSADFSWEALSVAISSSATVINVDTFSADFSWEAQSTTAIVNVAVQSADFSWEAKSVIAVNDIIVQSADFAWEANSVADVLNVAVQSADFSWEAKSTTAIVNVAVQSAEFDWKGQSVSLLTISSIVVQSAEFDYVVRGLQTFPLGNNPYTFTNGSNLVTVTHFDNHVYQVGDAVFLSGTASVGGFGFLNGFLNGLRIVLAVDNVLNTITVQANGTANNSGTGGGAVVKLSYLASVVQVIPNFTVGSADFSWKAKSTTAIVDVIVQSADFTFEALSATITQKHIVGTQSADFSWETDSIPVVRNLIAVSTDFTWESSNLSLALFLNPNTSKFDWTTRYANHDARLPVDANQLIQQHFLSGIAAKFFWKDATVKLSPFIVGRTPTSRIWTVPTDVDRNFLLKFYPRYFDAAHTFVPSLAWDNQAFDNVYDNADQGAPQFGLDRLYRVPLEDRIATFSKSTPLSTAQRRAEVIIPLPPIITYTVNVVRSEYDWTSSSPGPTLNQAVNRNNFTWEARSPTLVQHYTVKPISSQWDWSASGAFLGATNPNLVIDCSTFTTGSWVVDNAPSFGTFITDPNGGNSAQIINFTNPRSGFHQFFLPALQANTTYTASIFGNGVDSGAGCFMGYYNGSSPVTQYSRFFAPAVGVWSRSPAFTFTTGAGDANSSITIVNANVDGGSGPTGHVALWGCKVEIGTNATTFTGCATSATGGRNYLVGMYEDPTSYAFNSSWLGYDVEFTVNGAFAEDNSPFGGGDWPNTFVDNNNGYPRIYDLKMVPSGSAGTDSDYNIGAAGGFDAQWNTMFNNLRSVGPIYGIRLVREFNFSSASLSTAPMIACFRRFVPKFRAAFPGVKICWNPNVLAGDPRPYYPGDDVVDIICVDAYDEPGETPDFNGILTGTWGLNDVAAFATLHNKPIGFPEWGTNVPGVITLFANFFNTHNVVFHSFWNSADGSSGHWDNYFADSGLQAEFAAAFGHTRYTGTFWTLPLLPLPAGYVLAPAGNASQNSLPFLLAQWIETADIARLQSDLGRNLDAFTTFTDTPGGVSTMLSYPNSNQINTLWGPSGMNSNADFANFASGSLDADINTAIDAMVSATAPGKTLAVRVFHEFNYNTSPPISTFIAAWQHMVPVIRARAASHGVTILIDWNFAYPNAENALPNRNPELWYPGDAFVDIIGNDWYDSNQSTNLSDLRTGNNLGTTHGFDWQTSFAQAHGKMVSFPEVGMNTSIDGTLMTSWCNYLKSLGSLVAYYSHSNTNAAINGDRLTPGTANYTAFVNAFKGTTYGGNIHG